MTRYSDNIYSGFIGLTSAQSSVSMVELCQSYFVSAGTNVTQTISNLLPPGSQNLNMIAYVTQQGAATTNDNINFFVNGSAPNGQLICALSAIGSAQGRLTPSATQFRASAAANPQPPATGQTNGGEIPFKIIVSSVSTASYQIKIAFNRADTNFPSRG